MNVWPLFTDAIRCCHCRHIVSAPTPAQRVDQFLAHLTLHTIAPATAPTVSHPVASAVTGEQARTGALVTSGAGHHPLKGLHR